MFGTRPSGQRSTSVWRGKSDSSGEHHVESEDSMLGTGVPFKHISGTRAVGIAAPRLQHPLNSLPTESMVKHPLKSLPAESTLQHPLNSLPDESTLKHPVNALHAESTLQHPVNGLPAESTLQHPVNGLPAESTLQHPVNGLHAESTLQHPVNAILAESKLQHPVNGLPAEHSKHLLPKRPPQMNNENLDPAFSTDNWPDTVMVPRWTSGFKYSLVSRPGHTPNRQDSQQQTEYGDLSTKDSERQYRDGDLSTKDSEQQHGDGDLSTKDSEQQHRNGDLNRKDSEQHGGEGDFSRKDSEQQGRDGEFIRKDSEQQHGNGDLKSAVGMALNVATSRERHPLVSRNPLVVTDQAVKAPSGLGYLDLSTFTVDHSQPGVGPFFWVEGLEEGPVRREEETLLEGLVKGPAEGLSEGPSESSPSFEGRDALETNKDSSRDPFSDTGSEPAQPRPYVATHPTAASLGPDVSFSPPAESRPETEHPELSHGSDQYQWYFGREPSLQHVQHSQHFFGSVIQPFQHHRDVSGPTAVPAPALPEAQSVKPAISQGRVRQLQQRFRNTSPGVQAHRPPVTDSDHPGRHDSPSSLPFLVSVALKLPSFTPYNARFVLGRGESERQLGAKPESEEGGVRVVAGAEFKASQPEVEGNTTFGKQVVTFGSFSARLSRGGMTLSANSKGYRKAEVAKQSSSCNDDDTEEELSLDGDSGSPSKRATKVEKASRSGTVPHRFNIGLDSSRNTHRDARTPATADLSLKTTSGSDIRDAGTADRWRHLSHASHRAAGSLPHGPPHRNRAQMDLPPSRLAHSSKDKDPREKDETLKEPERLSPFKDLFPAQRVGEGDKHQTGWDSQPVSDAQGSQTRTKRNLFSSKSARRCPPERADECLHENEGSGAGRQVTEVHQEQVDDYLPQQTGSDEHEHVKRRRHQKSENHPRELAAVQFHSGGMDKRQANRPVQRSKRSKERSASTGEDHPKWYIVSSGGTKNFIPWPFSKWPIQEPVTPSGGVTPSSGVTPANDSTPDNDVTLRSYEGTKSSNKAPDLDDSDDEAESVKEEASVLESTDPSASGNQTMSGGRYGETIKRMFHLLDVYLHLFIGPFRRVPSKAGERKQPVLFRSRQLRHAKSVKTYRSYYHFPLGNSGWASLLNSRYHGLYRQKYLWSKM